MLVSKISGCCSMLSLENTEADLDSIKSKKEFVKVLREAIKKYNKDYQGKKYIHIDHIYSVMLISNSRHPFKFWLKRGFGYRLQDMSYNFIDNPVVYYVTFKNSLELE